MSAQGEEKLGPYRLLRLLGEGGMASVFLGEHERSGQKVALKRVKLPSESLLPRIRREITALSRMRHPGIVRVLDSGLEGGLPWYAMEWVEGATLRQVAPQLRDRGEATPAAGPGSDNATVELEATPPTLDISLGGDTGPNAAGWASAGEVAQGPRVSGGRLHGVLRMVRRICGPLAYLHGEGLVHRDLKPENILVRPDGRPVLVDFGLVGEFGGELSREALEGGGVAGTIAYIAPEQARGELVDARADLYSLGCILYELLVGERPFVGENYYSVLRQHFEVEPQALSKSVTDIPPELDALVLRLLAKNPRDRLGHASDVALALARLGALEAEEPGQPTPRAYLYRPGFAGRAEAVSRLEEHLGRLREGAGGLVLIGGESGVGKTRLALETLRLFKEGEFRVLTGECFQHSPLAPGSTGSVPLEALRKPLQAIADRCREWGKHEAERLVGPRVRVLESLEPAFSGIPGLSAYPALTELPPEAARARVFQALGQTLSALARDAPVLLVLDDLHWSDPLTIGWLSFLLRDGAFQRSALLMIGTYRTEEPNEALRELQRSAGVSQLQLGRLSEAAVGTMVVDMLALKESPAAFVRFLATHSEGNPFFVAEYLRTALAEGILYRDPDGRWRVRGAEAASEEAYAKLPLPTALRELVSRRLDGLDGAALRLTQAASVLGREVDAAVVARAGGLDEPEFLQASATLLRRQVLEEIREGFRFVHDKIREVAYEKIGPEARRELHAAAAEAVESRFGTGRYEHLVAIGQHWESAGRPELAARYRVEAGERAAASYEAREGLVELDRAVPALESALTDPDAGRMLLRALDARSRLRDQVGRFHEAEQDARRQTELAREIGDPRSLGRALRQTGIALYNTGDYDRALQAFIESLEPLEAVGDPEEICWSRQWAGWIHSSRGDHETALSKFREALAVPGLAENGPARLHCMMQEALTLYQQGKLQEVLPRTIVLQQRYLELGDVFNSAAVQATLGQVHNALGDTETGLRLLREATEVFRRLGATQYFLMHSNNIALIQAERGEFSRAAVLLAEMREVASRHGEQFLAATAALSLGRCQLPRGLVLSATQMVLEAVAVFERLGAESWRPIGLLLEALCRAARGDWNRAQAQFEAALGIARGIDEPREAWLVQVNWALASLERSGPSPEGRVHAERALALAEAIGAGSPEAIQAGLVLQIHDGVLAPWQQQFEQLFRAGTKRDRLQRLLLAAAEAAVLRGEASEARQLLQRFEALEHAEDLFQRARVEILRRELQLEAPDSGVERALEELPPSERLALLQGPVFSRWQKLGLAGAPPSEAACPPRQTPGRPASSG